MLDFFDPNAPMHDDDQPPLHTRLQSVIHLERARRLIRPGVEL
jgi:hypothetical protein